MVQDESKNIKAILSNAQNSFSDTLGSFETNLREKIFDFEIENFEEKKFRKFWAKKSRFFGSFFLKV